ncbi:hypothetical protein HMPREF9554_00677 [Treponema phagedenis F0421]|nr:hypothetical protein HMPREF9554_00677 [Treponema phagedenis F0421]
MTNQTGYFNTSRIKEKNQIGISIKLRLCFSALVIPILYFYFFFFSAIIQQNNEKALNFLLMQHDNSIIGKVFYNLV